MLDTILSSIDGNLSKDTCKGLVALAKRVPDEGTILDINCGEGRSTVLLAVANEQAQVISMDSHITNPLSATPYQEGNIMRYLVSMQRFKVSHRVIPVIISSTGIVSYVNKRSANLVVVQSPATTQKKFSEDGLELGIEAAKKAIRKGGTIAVCCPGEAYRESFERLVGRLLPDSTKVTNDLYTCDCG
jgi:tRNA1(Val) A37 N6-methylase TrmN6